MYKLPSILGMYILVSNYPRKLYSAKSYTSHELYFFENFVPLVRRSIIPPTIGNTTSPGRNSFPSSISRTPAFKKKPFNGNNIYTWKIFIFISKQLRVSLRRSKYWAHSSWNRLRRTTKRSFPRNSFPGRLRIALDLRYARVHYFKSFYIPIQMFWIGANQNISYVLGNKYSWTGCTPYVTKTILIMTYLWDSVSIVQLLFSSPLFWYW